MKKPRENPKQQLELFPSLTVEVKDHLPQHATEKVIEILTQLMIERWKKNYPGEKTND